MKIVDLPLHDGKVPIYLLKRMQKLANISINIMIEELGTKTVLKKFSDPLWFQAFSNFLGFDWHSSGSTTVTLGVLKSIKNENILFAGGKGKNMTKTHIEITNFSKKHGLDTKKLIEIDRIIYRIDNSYVQDNFSLYHHSFIIDAEGNYAIIQQGKNENYARRYHWDKINLKKIIEPHSGIFSDLINKKTLDLTKKENKNIQKGLIDFINEKDFRSLFKQKTLFDQHNIEFYYKLPKQHEFKLKDKERILLERLADQQITEFKEVILNINSKELIRALALAASIIYDIKLRYGDPKIYSYAHGGKDGIPKPIDYKTYDETIKTLEEYLKIKRIKF